MNYFIFSSELELLGTMPVNDYLVWDRNFYDTSNIEAQINFNKSDFEILNAENYIYKKDTDEFAIIENIKVVDGENKCINISARGLSSILDRRIVTSYDVADKTIINELFYQLVLKNCINPDVSARKIPNLTAENISSNIVVSLGNINMRNLLDVIKEYAVKYKVGFRIDLDLESKIMTFKTLIPVDKTSDIIFSKNFGNVLEQTYYKQLRDYKNVSYSNEGTVIEGTATGLSRREVFTDTLDSYKAIDTLETVPNLNAYPEYLKDYDLGDIVMTKNTDLGIVEPKIITQIRESYSEGGRQIELTFGAPVPTLLDKIKRSVK